MTAGDSFKLHLNCWCRVHKWCAHGYGDARCALQHGETPGPQRRLGADTASAL